MRLTLTFTLQVLWGVPDGEDLQCAHNSSSELPTCVNTSFPGYAGNWSMANTKTPGVRGGGLATATSYTPGEYGKYVHPFAVWTAEMAFPLHSSMPIGDAWHGGLLDPAANLSGFDPSQHEQVHSFSTSLYHHPNHHHHHNRNLPLLPLLHHRSTGTSILAELSTFANIPGTTARGLPLSAPSIAPQRSQKPRPS